MVTAVARLRSASRVRGWMSLDVAQQLLVILNLEAHGVLQLNLPRCRRWLRVLRLGSSLLATLRPSG